jgi:hypothetical protein
MIVLLNLKANFYLSRIFFKFSELSHIPNFGILGCDTNNANSHSSEHVPYQTRGATCCLGVSTAKIQSLVDSSVTIHIT